jgi:hypothetical protein
VFVGQLLGVEDLYTLCFSVHWRYEVLFMFAAFVLLMGSGIFIMLIDVDNIYL